MAHPLRRRHIRGVERGLLALAALLAAAPAAGAAGQAGQALAVRDAWFRFVIPARPAAGYFTLANDGTTPRTLVGAASPACGTLMLHRSLNRGGQDRMVMVPSVPVPAHGTLRFAPGGYHLMCMSPAKDMVVGHSVPVTLRFQDGGALTTAFAVRGPSGR